MNNIPVDKLMSALGERMKLAEGSMQKDFSLIRTGKASPTLVEGIIVEYYGTPTRLRDMANINAPEPRLLTIQPWDASALHNIEKAIIAADIGIMPTNDGKMLRLPVPELSSERRAQLVKQVKSRAEDCKVEIRNIRREANEVAKKAQKAGELTEDELKKMLDDIQKKTDAAIADIDKHVAAKEKELMSI